MMISVFGAGYVGLVTGICFAEMGNEVICVDIDAQKIAKLKDGQSPICEPGLDSLIRSNLEARRIHFTTDSQVAISNSDILFIAVGTPSDEDGSADLQYVFQVVNQIAENMNSYKLVVIKSTVPVGSCRIIKNTIQKSLQERGAKLGFDVVFSPEFLCEGSAIEDCLKPARVVVGCENESGLEIMQQLYEPFLKNGNPILSMDLASAELTKYAANAMLATKLTLMNEISRICEKTGADIENVRKGVGTDSRIGSQFLFAGIGYGGSCFPKDMRALIRIGSECEESLEILQAVERANCLQRQNFLMRIKNTIGRESKKIAVWGVAFKPGTDDIRHAPALSLIQAFLDDEIQVTAFDPVSAQNAKNYFQCQSGLSFAKDQYEALDGADCLVIVTEWKSFKEPDFEKIKTLLKKPVIFDGRNLYNLKIMRQEGFEYHSIGRPAIHYERH